MEHEHKRVTAVVTRDLLAGRERDYDDWVRRAAAASAAYGASGHTFLTPQAGGRRRVLVAHFADEAGARAWEQSEERARLVEEAAKFSTMEVQHTSGLEAWFTLPGERAIVPPPRWKQLLVTLIGAYPLVVLISAFPMPELQSWPLLLRSAVLPVLLLTLMTYAVMPLLTQVFRAWLYPRG